MPRPRCCRRITGHPPTPLFKPAGIPAHRLEVVRMTLDELEAVHLADREGLYHEAAAARMDVSRATFGRILEAAHRKIAEALIEGRALRIEGGPIVETPRGRCRCRWGRCEGPHNGAATCRSREEKR